jgi:hypothetical protein
MSEIKTEFLFRIALEVADRIDPVKSARFLERIEAEDSDECVRALSAARISGEKSRRLRR